MRNTEFQNTIKPGDTFVTNYGSIRHQAGYIYKFLGYKKCHHMDNTSCGPCKGRIRYEQPDRTLEGHDCMREYNNSSICDYLVMKVDIMIGPDWLDDSDWEL